MQTEPLRACVGTLASARDAVLAAESQAEAAYWRTVEAQELAEIRCRRPLRSVVRVAGGR